MAKSFRDKATTARIRARIDRVEAGNFGDTNPVGSGVSELRLPFGKGYRVYFGQDGVKLVVLLVGGDKATQEKDIKKAQDYWADYLERSKS